MMAPIRPRIATVVSVVWLYLGPPWLAIGLVGLYAGLAMGLLDFALDMSGALGWFYLLTGVSGGLGLAGALQLLQLRESGRKRLVAANWVAFANIVMFAFTAVATAVRAGAAFFLLPGLLCSLLSVPFAVMARKLARPELVLALRDEAARQSAGPRPG